MEKQHKKKKKKQQLVVLFPCPFQGHITPMLQLATILYSRGFSITVVHTHFNAPTASNYPNFTFIPIFNGLTSENHLSISDVMFLLDRLNRNCLAPFKDCLVKIMSQGEEEEDQVACIISDALMFFTKAVADDLQLPRIVLRTTGVACFLVYGFFPLLRQNGYLPIKDSEMEKLVEKLEPLRVKDLPVVNTQNQEVLYQILDDMVKSTKASSGLILNSFESLEPLGLETAEKEFQVPLFPIGPFHRFVTASSSSLLTQDLSCISWLDTQSAGSVLYVSFGSIAAMDQNDLLEVAWGLAKSERPFLWVLRPGLVGNCSPDISTEQLLPQKFHDIVSERGYIVKWAPQQEVLAHPSVGGFWTHSGWNSTMESICEGVPMICWPCFGDQLVNARYVSDVWKVGFRLEHGLQQEEIESAIRKLMVGKERKDIMLRVRDLKEKAELCLLNGGSSFNSLQNLVDLILSF